MYYRLDERVAASRPPAGISRDIREFLAGYPSQPAPSSSKDTTNLPSDNLTFYNNKSPARPSRLHCDDLHESLRGDYDELEHSHSFIQWLFPIREMGMNWASQPLQPHELTALRSTPSALSRLSTSYSIMLDFYGLQLVNPTTGQLARSSVPAPSPASSVRRYANLLRNSHNFLRITRILKCHSEFGREYLNAPFLLWVLVEQARGELDSPGLKSSMDGYWRYCIRNDDEREWVVDRINKVRRGAEWTEDMYKEALERREKTGSFAEVAEEKV
ncbi:hypothetical protein MNV49_007051 [Pseudohyphozyma bogoriensis]|nr:hypothetical protein MNV49_007051 [Pseudohyphozyma bogoriensis]